MTGHARILIALAGAALAVLPARASDRGAVSAPPPVEPSNLFSIPTARVVGSMDLDLSGTGVVLSEAGSRPLVAGVLGLGDIAQVEVGTIGIVSGLDGSDELVNVPSAGLKVYVPLARFARGIGASFRRSGTYAERLDGTRFTARVGEFYTVATVANYGEESDATAPLAGWNGLKVKGHLGMKYVDARLEGDGAVATAFWRPAGGVELWKNDARARVIGEVDWTPAFERTGGQSVQLVRVVTGGVRYFFSRHATFDIGVRHQSNYDGLAESAIQARLNLSLPTHSVRDRVIGL